MAQEHNQGGAVMAAFLIGGVVGVGVGLLIAPITGKEARERVKKATDIAKEKIIDMSEEIKSHAEELMEQTKNILEEVKTQIKATSNVIKEAAVHKKEELEEKVKKV
ncbi:MAG: YtxH domain-containing protein [bacterium]